VSKVAIVFGKPGFSDVFSLDFSERRRSSVTEIAADARSAHEAHRNVSFTRGIFAFVLRIGNDPKKLLAVLVLDFGRESRRRNVDILVFKKRKSSERQNERAQDGAPS
jgi:hypothetical protein